MTQNHVRADCNDRLLIRIVVWLAACWSVLAALVTLAAMGARWNSICELATHWPLQLTVSTVLACSVLLVSRRWKWAGLAGTIALVNAIQLAPLFFPQHHGAVAGPICRAISVNVHTTNQETNRFIEFARSQDADFMVVMEIDDRWREAIEELGDDYPFSIYRPRSHNFGIALLSRHVIRSERVASLDDSGVPTIIATVDFHGQPLNVVGTHPLPPIGRRRAALRDQHLARLGEVVLQLPHPTIVLGDLNVTSWSPCFRDLLKQSDLQDSRLGFGVQPTWPSNSWLLRIPIDHALVSRDLIVTERFVGPDIGSDHRPIVVEFARASR